MPKRTPWFDLETDAGDADLTIVGVPFDGSVSLRVQANGMYVCAENAGAAPLIANRGAVGAWEKFDLVTI